ncbi:MAG: ribosome biogenesis GTP-binding protein YihA/YsxC [Pseudomonadota bacterium]
MSIFAGTHFIASAHDPRELPPDVGREIAFAGRSNAGKSSAINALTARRKLAFVSKTPGRTQTINFFECGGNRRLVDLPGYGYAKVPIKERAHWGMLISSYLEQRDSLKGLVLIVDSRHPLTPLDQQLLGWYVPLGQPVLVLLTKADKLTRQDAAASLKHSQALLEDKFPMATAQLFSAVAGTGLRTAQNIVHGWLK